MTTTSTLSTVLIIDEAVLQTKAAHEAAVNMYAVLDRLNTHLAEVTKERDLTECERIAFSRLKGAMDAYGAFMETRIG